LSQPVVSAALAANSGKAAISRVSFIVENEERFNKLGE
jgi:hypothetical protein